VPAPRGNLVTPIGVDALGNLYALLVDAEGRLQIDVVASGLPAGAATSALQLPDGHNVVISGGLDALATSAWQDTINKSLGRLTAVTPTIYNKTMAVAGTEYSQALPATVKKFTVQCRGPYDVNLCFVAAGSDTLYITIKAGQCYWEDNLYRAATTLYFDCETAGQVLEIVAWS